MPPSTFEHGYALLIGVGNTRHKPSWSLPVTVKDGKEIRSVLVDPERCGYPSDQVHLLHNESACYAQIRGELEWLATVTKDDKNATVFIFFSGHGWQSEDGRYCLIPSDVDPDDFGNSVLWADELAKLIEKVSAARLFVIFDCCHAGGLGIKGAEAAPPMGFTKIPPSKAALESLAKGEGRVILASCRANEKSYIRSDDTLSVFTYHLLEALNGSGSNEGERYVHTSTVWKWLSDRVPESGISQTPWMIFGEGEAFPLALLRKGNSRFA